METSTIHQLAHGYRRGHQLLAGSINLDARESDLVARLSDLSGSLAGGQQLQPYLTCYPLKDYYAIARTWPDTDGPRAGCVLTHTLLVPLAEWGIVRNPSSIDHLFTPPTGYHDLEQYRRPLKLGMSSMLDCHCPPFEPSTSNLEHQFVSRYFGDGLRPLVWFGEKNAEGCLWAILYALWPSLRRDFACCTFSLQPLSMEGRAFELMFAPMSVYSRFLKLPKGNLIIDERDALSSKQAAKRPDDPWLSEWVRDIFHAQLDAATRVDDLGEIGSLLEKDPTEIRKRFLIHSLMQRANTSTEVAVSLLDALETVAPLPDQALELKKKAINTALSTIRHTTEPRDGLSPCARVSDHLQRSAFAWLRSRIEPGLSLLVSFWTQTQPALCLSTIENQFPVRSQALDSPFVTGVSLGLYRLQDISANTLKVLHDYPSAASLVVAKEPQLARTYLQIMDEQGLGGGARRDLAAWLISLDDTEIRTRLRDVLIPELKNDEDAYLLDELLSGYTEVDLAQILSCIASNTTGFASLALRRVATERIANVYPEHVKRWALQVSTWPPAVVTMFAASFSADAAGFTDLLTTPGIDAYRRACAVVAYVSIVDAGQFPSWLRNVFKSEPVAFRALVPQPQHINTDICRVISRVLDDVNGIPAAHSLTVLESLSAYTQYPFGPKLVDACMRDAISGFIRGTIDWDLYERWQETAESRDWFHNVNAWILQSLTTRGIFDNQAAWCRAWKWLSYAPDVLYCRTSAPIQRLTLDLISHVPSAWPEDVIWSWVRILHRASNEAPPKMHLLMCADALNFAFQNKGYPLGAVIAESFYTVYSDAVGPSPQNSSRFYSSLFNIFDWDKGKELRKRLVDTFVHSRWAPGDLALAAHSTDLLRKVYKRVMQLPGGEAYVTRMLQDLKNREDNKAQKIYRELYTLVNGPDFQETWI